MNRILSITRNTIPYVKELMPIAGSVTACILMQQLDFWFDRHPDGFYKFMDASPDHPAYREGDSWAEELAISVDEFRTAFDRLGIRYTSKSKYDAAADKFVGHYYCSYYDRRRQLTFYFRNDELVNTVLDALIYRSSGVQTPPSFTPPGLGRGGFGPDQAQKTAKTLENHGPFTVGGLSQSPVNGLSQFTGDQEQQDTGDGERQVPASGGSPDHEVGISHVQEVGNSDLLSTELTNRHLQRPQPQPRAEKASGSSGDDLENCNSKTKTLIYPNLGESEKRNLVKILDTCPLEERQHVLDELAGAIEGKRLKVGAIPFVRSLVQAVETGAFFPNLGVAVEDRRNREIIAAKARQDAASRIPVLPDKLMQEDALSRLPASLQAKMLATKAKRQQGNSPSKGQ
jgi:hypothetical protein